MSTPKWLGQISNADPADLPPGAMQSQYNFECIVPGRLTGRKGKRPVVFDNAISDTAYTAIAMARFKAGHGDFVVYEDSNGNLKIGRNPA